MNNYRFVLFEWWMDKCQSSEFTVRALNEKEAKAEAAAKANDVRSTFNETHIHFICKE